MSITVMERANSQALINDPRAMSVTREYWAQCDDPAEDVGEVNDAVAIASPNFYLGMIKQRIKPTPVGGGFWYVTVEYGQIQGTALAGQGIGTDSPTLPTNEIGDEDKLGPEFSFTTSGGTEHVTRSLGTVEESGFEARNPPETNNAIGVTKNGVAGVDVVAPKFEFSVTRRASYVTMKYINRLVDCTGCVNNEKWNGIQHHCALFLGAEGSYNGQKGDDWWLITYKFLIGKNETDIVIRSSTNPDAPNLGLTIKKKFAHDYLWVGYENDKDATAGVLLQVPWFAKVERLYKEKDFKRELGF